MVFPLRGERASLPIVALAKLGVMEKEAFASQRYAPGESTPKR
jgi:hypothetical protein